MKISVIIPLIQESKYLFKLLDSIDNQNINFQIEVILVSDERLSIKKFKYDFDLKEIIFKGLPPNKRDYGFNYSKGDIILFTDDDAYLPKNYFYNLKKLYDSHGKKICLVGPSLTPDDDSYVSEISDHFFSSKFLFYFNERNKILNKNFFVSDWPTVNFTIPREIFISVGKFNSNIWPGEDTYLCNKIILKNFKILYSGLIFNYHYRRSTFLSLFRQIYRYGLHRGILLKSLKFNISNFIFYLLISILLFLVLLTLLTSNFVFLKIFIFLYLLNLFFGFFEMLLVNRKLNVVFLFILSPMLHFFYFIGLFSGILKPFFIKHKSRLGR